MTAQIQCPPAMANANVVGGATGSICTKGIIAGFARFAGYGLQDSNVRVKVWDGHITNPPENPPAATDIPVTSNRWQGYVAVSSSSTMANTAPLTLFAWDMYGSGPYPYTYRWFYGLQATTYDCCNSILGQQPTAVVVLAPIVWRINLAEFESTTDQINGPWDLKLQELASGKCVWSNGGDGFSIPKIELISSGPPDASWSLQIQFGEINLRYSAPANWNAVGELKLSAVNRVRGPAIITVNPG